MYPPFGILSGPGFVFGTGWALATPFTMSSASQFRPAPPPSTSSFLYRLNYNNVKSVGAFNSMTRTEE
jgi:hypothetical protein